MVRIVYLGDEATAAGFRLAGAQVLLPDPADAEAALRAAVSGDVELILLSDALAAGIDAELLDEALVAQHPLLSILPESPARDTAPDLAIEVRRALGIEA